MKVLVFTTLYPNDVAPNHGVFIKERMTCFASLDGVEVKVIAPVPYFPKIKLNWRWRYSQVTHFETRDGIEVYHPRYCMMPKVGMSLYGIFMFLFVLRTVRKIQITFDFDLIDAHFVYPDGFAAVLLGSLLNKPVVVSARGSDISLFASFPLIRRILRYTLRKADAVISVSAALKEAITRLGISEDKVIVIPNGVDLDKFYRVSKAEARKRLRLPAEKKIVLSVGGLTPVKGFDLLIGAIHRLITGAAMSNLCLIIAGEGNGRSDLEKLVSSLGRSNDVRFTGVIPHHELYLWYSAADLFCLASSREGWPNVLLESLACGTPVVAADVWGIPEVVRSTEVGLLSNRSEHAIAGAILVALRKHWQSDDLVQYAKAHSWKRTAEAVRDVFEFVVNRREACAAETPPTAASSRDPFVS